MMMNQVGFFLGRRYLVLAYACVACLVACSSPSPIVSNQNTGRSAADIETNTVAKQSFALTLNAYKRDVARQIHQDHPEQWFEGAPPPMLKSIIVLTVKIDREGRLQQVKLLRSNGYKALENLAMQSLHKTVLPLPNRLVMKDGVVEYVETWLFRDDGRFQIRSLAEAQADSE